MGIARKFIDWRRPALQETVEFLFQEYHRDGHWDLSQVVLVFAGSRAGRRLMELLVDRADRESCVFLPLQTTTVGALPELLYQPKRPFASKLVQKLAWVEALRDTPRRRLKKYVPHPPENDEMQRWLDLAELIWKQHRELAADGMSFADVARIGPQIEGFDETSRWKFFSDVQERYLGILDGLELWDRQTARLFAIQYRELQTDHSIVLVGTVDMNRALRQMLDQVGDHVTALVFAPEYYAARFDSHGCLLPQAWQKVNVPVEQDQVQAVDDPPATADAVINQLREYEGELRADQIKIGVPDERLAPIIGRRLLDSGVKSRWVVGKAIPQTRPYQLLRAMGTFVTRLRYSEFAALVRHPDLYQWLSRAGLQGDWLTELDRYYQAHLPPQLGDWLGKEEATTNLVTAYSVLSELLAPLMQDDRPLTEWADVFLEILTDVYAETPLDREDPEDHYQIAALGKIRDVLLEFREVPSRLVPQLNAAQAIQMVLEPIRAETLPPPHDPNAMEMLGWLELPWEDASVVIVTGMNEGIVPTSVNSDLFLPNSLRQRLGILDNQRRYARDAYALSVIVESTTKVHLLFARRDEEGDPLTPSRLLFACDRDEVKDRALAFFADIEEAEADGTADDPALSDKASKRAGDKHEPDGEPYPRHSAFFVPAPEKQPHPMTGLPVTAFRSYLACPYRFYLRHVLKLDEVHDQDEELNAPGFGNLLHEVLARFGESAARGSASESEIREYLRSELYDFVTECYGIDRLPAIDVQMLQAQLRLDAFARWQATWADKGWEIRFTEKPTPEQTASLPLRNGKQLKLYGRIDRIDYHPDRDEWIIFDYKTSNEPLTPERNHKRGGDWVDLQLPLYLRLAETLDVPADAQLGYIALPRDPDKVGPLLAKWTDKDLAAADRMAMDVATKIIKQEFWPPKYPPPRLMQDYATICQDQVLYRQLAEMESTA